LPTGNTDNIAIPLGHTHGTMGTVNLQDMAGGDFFCTPVDFQGFMILRLG